MDDDERFAEYLQAWVFETPQTGDIGWVKSGMGR